jgi:serine/threonine protein kinase
MFDIGEWQGERFLTMEFIDGTTLKNVVRREAPGPQRLPLGRTVELILPVCAGLGAAHAAGVLHRDLKPDEAAAEEAHRASFRMSREVGAPR